MRGEIGNRVLCFAYFGKDCSLSLSLSLTSVPVPLEVEIQLQNTTVKAAPKPLLTPVRPLPVDDFKGDIFVRGAGADAKDGVVLGVTRLETIRRQLRLVHKI